MTTQIGPIQCNRWMQHIRIFAGKRSVANETAASNQLSKGWWAVDEFASAKARITSIRSASAAQGGRPLAFPLEPPTGLHLRQRMTRLERQRPSGQACNPIRQAPLGVRPQSLSLSRSRASRAMDGFIPLPTTVGFIVTRHRRRLLSKRQEARARQAPQESDNQDDRHRNNSPTSAPVRRAL